MSQKPKFPPPTDAQTSVICKYLSRGALVATAAAKAGIPQQVLNYWLIEASRGVEPYCTFAAKIEEASLDLELKLLTFLESNIDKSVAAATWLFKLRFGAKYQKAAEVEAGVEHPEFVTPKAVAEDELEAAEARMMGADKKAEKLLVKETKAELKRAKEKAANKYKRVNSDGSSGGFRLDGIEEAKARVFGLTVKQ